MERLIIFVFVGIGAQLVDGALGMAFGVTATTLLVVLGVSIWAAILPWLAGAGATLGGLLSVLALAYPLAFMLTAPAGRARKPAPSLPHKVGR